MNMYSNHPYEPYIVDDATKIIIGSMPPYRFCIENGKIYDDDVNFFYGSNRNNFWKLVGEVTNTNFLFSNTKEAIIQRKRWLADNHIGITDVVLRCIHKDGKSDDNSLVDIEYRSIDSLLLKYDKINTIICTSDFVRRHVKKIIAGNWKKVSSRRWYVQVDGRNYDVIILYSPSPNSLRGMGINGKEKRINQYKEVFKI